jgi:spore germination cell wall hydrolase CwlJ-like protein
VRPILPSLLAAVLALSACATSAPAPGSDTVVASRSVADPSADALRAVDTTERACLAEAVYYEAGQSREGFEAVAHVVVNRARDPRFPRTVCGVIADGCQFSYRCEGRSLALGNPERRARAHQIATEVLAGAAPDPTAGALFFHAAWMKPGWFSTRPRIGEFGGNVFYR